MNLFFYYICKYILSITTQYQLLDMLRKLFTLIVCLVAAVATTSAQTPPDNEIWYTTTDGRTISFNDNDLVSNSYNNGRGVLKFRDSVTCIGVLAFRSCSSLTSITIPNSVTSIGDSAFQGCSSLKSFKGKYASSDGRCLIIEGELIAFAPAELTSYTIPNSVTSIGVDVFWNCSSLTSITIPDSVTWIEGSAFAGCSNLTSITIPNSVRSIGRSVFVGCTNLKHLTIGCDPGLIPEEILTQIESVTLLNPELYDYFDSLPNMKKILYTTE